MSLLPRVLRSHAIAAAVALALAGTAHAQVSTATIKGQITAGDTSAPAGTPVVATNKASGFTYRTTTKDNGGYALTSLPPGQYVLTITGPDGAAKSEELTVAVGETATIDFSVGKSTEKVEEIVVTGTSRRKNVKTSEVGTNVSQKLIQAMPQVTRNFMSSADLAPGVAFVADQTTGQATLRSGAQDKNNSNVFIDGISQKNNVLRGGMSGQDSTRGNPFPQSAVAEYKVLTQNYKAEYDQVSSAAITAVTKSGGNELHGGFYYDRTESDWRAISPFDAKKQQAGQFLSPSNKNEAGLNVGGPIKEDVVNYFLAYDYKDINDSRTVVPKNLGNYGDVGLVPYLKSRGGSYVWPFQEHLVFGKMNAQLSEDRKLWASVKLRFENDTVPESSDLSAPGNAKDRLNNDFRMDVVHEWNVGPDLLSETKASFQNAVWNPESDAKTALIKYRYSATNVLAGSQDIIFDGGSPDAQKRGQTGFTVGQDVTFTGLRNNVVKGGAKVSLWNYDLSGTARSVDVVEAVVDTTTGLPYYDGTNCTGTNVTNGGSNSDQCKIDRALAPTSVSLNNTQIGLYVQDDITVMRRFEFNVGVRWDVETNMLNNGYTTPADRVAAMKALDGPRWGITPPAGQTYEQSLAKGGIVLDDYISTGDSRKAFLGAIAPRVGFSYDVLGDRNTVLFGGWGRSYDRAMANHALDEKQKNSQPNGEIWLIRNDLEMPYADQASLGIRQGVAFLNLEAAISQVHAKNQFQWFSGNRDANGGWATQPSFDPLWGGPNGYGSLILGDTIGENRTRMLMLKAEKPYTSSSRWSANVAYTLSDAKTKHREWDDDIFDWSYGRTERPWNASRLVDKHRLVAGAMTDGLPWGVMLSGRYSFGSGLARRIVGCPTGGCVVLESDSPAFHQFDVGLSKSFKPGASGEFILRADVLNLFNKRNYSLPSNPWGGGDVAPGGKANSVGLSELSADVPDNLRGPMRTVKITGTYNF